MAMILKRVLTIIDKDGVEHQIRTKEELDAILAQMTPQEYEDWKTNYRFTPITNRTGIIDYVGTSRDIS